MNKKLMHRYIKAKHGKNSLSIVYKIALNEYPALNDKFLKLVEKNPSMNVLAEKLNIPTLAVELLANANKFQIIYTTAGSFIRKVEK